MTEVEYALYQLPLLPTVDFFMGEGHMLRLRDALRAAGLDAHLGTPATVYGTYIKNDNVSGTAGETKRIISFKFNGVIYTLSRWVTISTGPKNTATPSTYFDVNRDNAEDNSTFTIGVWLTYSADKVGQVGRYTKVEYRGITGWGYATLHNLSTLARYLMTSVSIVTAKNTTIITFISAQTSRTLTLVNAGTNGNIVVGAGVAFSFIYGGNSAPINLLKSAPVAIPYGQISQIGIMVVKGVRAYHVAANPWLGQQRCTIDKKLFQILTPFTVKSYYSIAILLE